MNDPTNQPGPQQTAWTISTAGNPTLPMLVPGQQQHHAPTPTSDRAPLSIYERIRHFLYINLLLNKYSFILSILSYVAQLLLFVALNLYLFSNVGYLYELTCVRLPPPPPSSQNTSSIWPLLSNSTQSKFTSSIKQSYLTLQIITLFVFFICFIMAALIRLQFKYHRLALNLYDYDLEQGRGGHRYTPSNAIATTALNMNDRDGGDSLASTTTGSHFSSSMSKRLTSLLKRLLHRLLTKIASILLYVTIGYQFCQNCFIESNAKTKITPDSYTVFIHVCIAVAVVFRSVVVVLEKRNSMNKLDYVKRLQRKQMLLNDRGLLYGLKSHQQSAVDEIELAPSRTGKHYDYLIKCNQSAFNQLKQHQQNQTRFRVFQLNDVSLLVGFTLAIFHLFSLTKALQLFFVLSPILFTLILFRLKSVLNAVLSLLGMFVALFYLSSIARVDKNPHFIVKSASPPLTHNISSIVDKTFSDDDCGGNHSTIHEFQSSTNILELNIYGLNLLTLVSFLITLYLKSALSIYYCTLTSLERWNIAFLSTVHSLWRQLTIWASFVVYVGFGVACGVALLLSLMGNWRVFVLVPIYVVLALLWIAFQLLNTVNLLHLINKIGDCLLLLNESSSLGAENSSNVSRKSKSNRQSTLSQQSQSNHNLSSGSVSASAGKTTRCSLRKILSRFLSYHKLNVNDESGHAHALFNVPIHRILNYKGVRHLGSISYRISLYCMGLTLILSPFAFISLISASFPITVGLYVTTISISLVFLSLLYQFPASQTGSCLAYVAVSPPLAFNIYQNQTMSSNGGGTSATMSSSSTGNSKTTTSSSKSRTGSSGLSVAVGTTGYMPFNYQQALQHRCAYILQRMQAFLQFHLIDNFGCDLAPPNGFKKNVLESKLAAFFRKRPSATDSNSNPYYNTYLLYYCGPTSPLTDSLAFVDGSELSLDEIISLWKSIHCPQSNESISKVTSPQCTGGNQPQTSSDEETVVSEAPKIATAPNTKSRLIIILDAENTSKSLEYVRNKCREANVYVALQTAKYNYLGAAKTGKSTMSKQGVENRLLSKRGSKKFMSGPPGSPQTFTGTSQSFFDSYLNMGKFTLDWIKSNSNAAAGGGLSSNSYDAGAMAGIGLAGEIDPAHSDPYYIKSREFDEHAHLQEDDEDEEDDDPEEEDSDDDDSSQDFDDAAATTTDATQAAQTSVENPVARDNDQMRKSLKKSTAPLPPTSSHQPSNSHHQPTDSSTMTASSTSGSFFYEAKCAFSHYWLDFTFDSAEQPDDSSIAADLTQFWNIYYPCRVCRPILAMINCPLFYLKLEPLRKLLLWARRFKARLLPVHEFETGHGFKLFSS